MTQVSPDMVERAARAWISPDDAIADDLFDIDQEVEAECTDGVTRRIYFGYVSGEAGGDWLAFYDGDGVEVFTDDIKAVRAAPTPERQQ